MNASQKEILQIEYEHYIIIMESDQQRRAKFHSRQIQWNDRYYIIYRNATSQAVELILFHLKSKHYDFTRNYIGVHSMERYSVFSFFLSF